MIKLKKDSSDQSGHCSQCRQEVPKRSDGTAVTHYVEAKAGHGNKKRVSLCAGTGQLCRE